MGAAKFFVCFYSLLAYYRSPHVSTAECQKGMRDALIALNASAFAIMCEIHVASPPLAEMRALLNVPQLQLGADMAKFSKSHPFAEPSAETDAGAKAGSQPADVLLPPSANAGADSSEFVGSLGPAVAAEAEVAEVPLPPNPTAAAELSEPVGHGPTIAVEAEAAEQSELSKRGELEAELESLLPSTIGMEASDHMDVEAPDLGPAAAVGAEVTEGPLPPNPIAAVDLSEPVGHGPTIAVEAVGSLPPTPTTAVELVEAKAAGQAELSKPGGELEHIFEALFPVTTGTESSDHMDLEASDIGPAAAGAVELSAPGHPDAALDPLLTPSTTGPELPVAPVPEPDAEPVRRVRARLGDIPPDHAALAKAGKRAGRGRSGGRKQ